MSTIRKAARADLFVDDTASTEIYTARNTLARLGALPV